MAEQEAVRALQDYVQMEQRMDELLQKKKELDKKIRHYQIPREEPVPKHPSKIGVFFKVLEFSLAAVFFALFLLEAFIPIMSKYDVLRKCYIPGVILMSVVFTPIQYKREDSEACAEYVRAGFLYQEWEKGRREELPVLQKQLNQVMSEGGELYSRYQNAKLRSILHEDYLPYAKIILGYFQRGRVRDLTGAVNLLEQELMEYRRDMETAAYRDEMRQQAQIQTDAALEAAAQGERAATAAEDAAFWGAAATYFAAKNARKNDSGDYHIV